MDWQWVSQTICNFRCFYSYPSYYCFLHKDSLDGLTINLFTKVFVDFEDIIADWQTPYGSEITNE